MILDMNINLDGIDEEFLDDFEELIEDTRVEYFIINPETKEQLEKTQELCKEYERFKYTLPIQFIETKDGNCVALKVSSLDELQKLDKKTPIVIDSSKLNNELIDTLNNEAFEGVILDAKESDTKVENFAYSISHSSLKEWSKQGITDTDFNRIALQSDYPKNSYDDLLDVLLKDISDLTFRAEQTIAAGGTRTVLRTFGLL